MHTRAHSKSDSQFNSQKQPFPYLRQNSEGTTKKELELTYAVTNYLLEPIDYLSNQLHAHTCAHLHMHCIMLSWAISCEPARPRLSLSCTPCTHSTTCTAHVQTCEWRFNIETQFQLYPCHTPRRPAWNHTHSITIFLLLLYLLFISRRENKFIWKSTRITPGCPPPPPPPLLPVQVRVESLDTETLSCARGRTWMTPDHLHVCGCTRLSLCRGNTTEYEGMVEWLESTKVSTGHFHYYKPHPMHVVSYKHMKSACLTLKFTQSIT